MFVLRDAETFQWPVDVRVPSATKPGTHDVHRFFATFAVLPISEVEDVVSRIQQLRGNEAIDEVSELATQIVRGWRDVQNDDGQAIPFSPEALGQAFGVPWFRAAIFAAYADATQGRSAKARARGN